MMKLKVITISKISVVSTLIPVLYFKHIRQVCLLKVREIMYTFGLLTNEIYQNKSEDCKQRTILFCAWYYGRTCLRLFIYLKPVPEQYTYVTVKCTQTLSPLRTIRK